MKNIIPFKKDVIFKTNISEITSISLENTLSINDGVVKGEFIVNGEYKVSEKSTTVERFNLDLPFEILIDERYNTEKATIDIDDFYYEIINDNVLRIAIDVLVDSLEEKTMINDFDLIDEAPKREIIEIPTEEIEDACEIVKMKNDERCIENELEEEASEKINSIFNQISFEKEVYVTYNVYIVREGDTLDSILTKYNIEIDDLKKYNDLTELKLGDKLIIPNNNE